MTIDTGELVALRAEVARLAGVVDSLAQRAIAVEEIYRAGQASSGLRAQGRPRHARSSGGQRPSHLRAVDGSPGGAG